MTSLSLHDNPYFVCLCTLCVKRDPDSVFKVAYAAHKAAPVAAAGTRRELRELLNPTYPLKAQREQPDSMKLGYGLEKR